MKIIGLILTLTMLSNFVIAETKNDGFGSLKGKQWQLEQIAPIEKNKGLIFKRAAVLNIPNIFSNTYFSFFGKDSCLFKEDGSYYFGKVIQEGDHYIAVLYGNGGQIETHTFSNFQVVDNKISFIHKRFKGVESQQLISTYIATYEAYIGKDVLHDRKALKKLGQRVFKAKVKDSRGALVKNQSINVKINNGVSKQFLSNKEGVIEVLLFEDSWYIQNNVDLEFKYFFEVAKIKLELKKMPYNTEIKLTAEERKQDDNRPAGFGMPAHQ
jgi:hypothetical protein